MAENTHMRNNALPYPIYAQPYTIVFPLLDADGDPISPSSADTERSLNGDTASDCTNEATEISGLTGVCYLDLLAAEMTANVVALETSSTGAKTTINVLYPRKLVTIRAGTANDDGSGTSDIVLDSGASAVDDFYNGMAISVVIDAGAPQVRLITDYVGSTKTATVHADFLTAVDNTDTFTIFLPEGHQIQQANVTHAAEVAWGSGAITAGAIATDAIGAAELADGAITAATFAAGAIDATAIAADAIGDSEIAADVYTAIWAHATRSLTIIDEDSTTLDLDATIKAAVGLASADLDTQLAALPTAAENADAVWDEDATGHQSGGTFGQAIGDPGANTETMYAAVVTDAAGTNVAADIIAVKAETASILADTGTDGVVLANDAITAAKIAANAITSSEIADGAITSAKFAAGAIDATAIANSAIDAATFAAGAIDAAAIAADAGTEIATAVWASGTRSLTVLDEDSTTIDIDNSVWGGGTRTLTALDEDSTTLDLDATIRSAVGLASANLDTQIDALPTAAENTTAVLTTAMTEAYAADGAAPTLAQALFLIQQILSEKDISSTTLTVKKLDGTTTAATFTLNSATAPTSVTRSG
jgi:hypothetical protein